MTSVLYHGSLNYQTGNPVRQEIVAVRREVDILRKQIEMLIEENLVYRKHIMLLSKSIENGPQDFTRDLMSLSNDVDIPSQREAGGRTVQGSGFRR
jgi:hypothetical protein